MKNTYALRRLLPLFLAVLMILGACSEPVSDLPDKPSVSMSDNGNEKAEPRPAACFGLFPEHGELAVDGSQLVNEAGDAFVLKGISTHGLTWYSEYVNMDSFKTLRDDWGVNLIRLAMYTAESNGYCISSDSRKEELKEIVSRGVDCATELGLYVIVDWHILTDENPNLYKEDAKEFFAYMAKKYAGNGNVLYEICNEPNGDTSWEEICDYANEVIPVIREYDDDGIIIVGTPSWSQAINQAASNPLSQYDNIMYTLHFYAATHGNWLRVRMQRAIEDYALPVFVTEFGITDASGTGAVNVPEGEEWLALLDEYNVSRCIWSLSNKDETSALLDKNCEKLSDWKDSDLTFCGKWYKNLLGNHGESTVSSSNVIMDATEAGCEGRAEIVNSWNSGSKYYCQCLVTVENKGENVVSSWRITIKFSTEVKQSQLPWNGSFMYDGDTVTVAPVAFNSSISPKSTVTDIGFIVESDKPIEITEVTLE